MEKLTIYQFSTLWLTTDQWYVSDSKTPLPKVSDRDGVEQAETTTCFKSAIPNSEKARYSTWLLTPTLDFLAQVKIAPNPNKHSFSD